MSVQFGRCNFEGRPPTPQYIERVSAVLAPYGPDSNEAYYKGGLVMLYRAFHTTQESHRETQPHISPSGTVITWDGRLDNRAELVSDLRHSLTIRSTDIDIVAAAYEEWGSGCLRKLIGDWALSVWNPNDRSLRLAKDPTGTKHLYYAIEKDHLTWSTILDPLVLFAGRTFEMSEEYLAGWFSHLPAEHLTPYVGIHAVPASSCVLLQPGKHGIRNIVTKYWDFDPGKRIRYRTDAEYQEHFRTVFATAVQRRLRSDRVVLAELSGGMDSSSIVCMADNLIARGQAECPNLDTISWFNSSNPNWDDPVYFAKIEEKRGRIGYHIDLGLEKQRGQTEGSSNDSLLSEFGSDRFAVIPSPPRRLSSELFKQAAAYTRSQGFRVVLSGIGGEQPMGGCTPTPTPELQNLLVRSRFFTLARQVNAWAEKMRKPRTSLLWKAMRGFFPLMFQERSEYLNPAGPWFHPGFVRRNRAALDGDPSRIKLFGALPSFQEHLCNLDSERRVLAYMTLVPEMLHEIRYPYHDRDLREFAYAIPREQVVGVGKRRLLMKRALVGIVPNELLNRKQKSFAPAGTQKEVWTEWPNLAEMGWRMVGSSIGIIDPDQLWETLQRAWRKEEVPIGSLRRTLFLESWLRHLKVHGLLTNPVATKGGKEFSPLGTEERQSPARRKSSAS